MEANLSKIVVKTVNKEDNSYKWVHFCYIPEELLTQYKERFPEAVKDFNLTLSRWCKTDFGKDLEIGSQSSFEELKGLIKAQYKEKYPELYLDQSTDRQGWLRVWVSTKMMEDLQNNGE